MKKFIVLSIVLLILAGFAITSSAQPVTVTLFADQTLPVGTLTVEVVGDNLEVTYEITDPGWELLETHLYVGKTDPEDLTSAPGQFPYSEEYGPAVFTSTYIILMSEIDSYRLKGGKKWVADGDLGIEPGDQIYIAAQAEIGMIDEFGDPVLDPDTEEPIEETAWAEGDPIRPDKNWAMYFEFVEFVVSE